MSLVTHCVTLCERDCGCGSIVVVIVVLDVGLGSLCVMNRTVKLLLTTASQIHNVRVRFSQKV